MVVEAMVEGDILHPLFLLCLFALPFCLWSSLVLGKISWKDDITWLSFVTPLECAPSSVYSPTLLQCFINILKCFLAELFSVWKVPYVTYTPEHS